MGDLFTLLLVAFPIALAAMVGRLFASRPFWTIGIFFVTVASLYPLAHWYLLHYGFGLANSPNNKDDFVGAGLIWLLMIAEVPICFVASLIGRSTGRLAHKSYGDL